MQRAIERRKHQRFLAKEGSFVTLQSNQIQLWQILDIGERGLAFRYIDGQLADSSRLDILTSDLEFVLEHISFAIVSVLDCPKDTSSSYPLKRCGVRFGQLGANQAFQLENFIRTYTDGNA